MTVFPHYDTRVRHLLDGIWDFTFLADIPNPENLSPNDIRFDDRMAVPGVFDSCPAYAGKRGTGVYRTTLQVTPGTRGLIKLHGLGLWAAVFVDGECLEVIELPYSGITVEVHASEKEERELVIITDNRFDFERVPLFEQFFDFYGYGGIYRSVEWFELPDKGYFSRIKILPTDLQTGKVQADIYFTGDINPEEFRFEIDGETVEAENFEANSTGGFLRATLRIPVPELWSPENPCLHTLKVESAADSITERFGLRKVEAKDGKILLNGKPLKLRGCCRHEAHPQFGPALPEAQLVQDLQLLKNLNCNFVRGVHYPQDPRFLELCDELGMLVWEESLGWGQAEERHWQARFCDLQEKQARQMARNSFNHPSVIIHGFLNEGGSDIPEMRSLYERLYRVLREESPGRLITYASNRPFRDISFELCDIVAINIYPGWYAKDSEEARPLGEISDCFDRLREHLRQNGHADKPLIISEIGAGAIYGWRDQLACHWSEEYQAEYLCEVTQQVMQRADITGVALWQFCDCRTYSSSRALARPRSFNNKGLFDEYRRQKLACTTVSKNFGAANSIT